MQDSIDDLARRWMAQPDAAGAISLCDTMRQSSSPSSLGPLVDKVGKLATERHAANGGVLVAVARMYTAAEKLSDAQGVLVSAGRVAPRDAAVFRLLGEVLLRRGDAERAEKVLQRAKQLGANDPETAMWMDRARVFKPVQAKAGTRAVAVEIKNTSVHPVTPHPDMIPPPRAPAASVDQDAMTAVRVVPPGFFDNDATVKPNPTPFSMPTEANAPRGILDFPQDIPANSPLDVAHAVARPTAPRAMGAPLPAIAAPAPRPQAAMPSVTQPRGALPSFGDRTDVMTADRLPDRHQPEGRGKDAAARIPAPKEVLDALTNAGVFEAREASAGAAVWDRPTEKARRRTAVGLGIGVIVFVLGSGGVLAEIHRRRAIAHDEAERILAKVEVDLAASKSSLLPQVEQTLGHAFELDSRSPRAASDWLEERAIKGLLEGGADLAFEDAVTRALEVKVPEEKVAYARVAAFLFQGDTGGAAALMPKWDGPAAKEPLYQVITGATLDHAGAPHAADRYLAATTLDPSLVVAEILLARATAIDGDPTKAAELAKQFRTKHPDRSEGAALVALAWGRDPARGEQAPPEVAESIAHASELPTPLLAVPYALEALLAVDKHQLADARAAIEKGLAVADDPGMATWLGSIALDTRDEALVRKAALLAVTFSAVYPPARVLAGRIALMSGRLDDALKATEELDPASPDVAVVRAAAAYERVDADGVARALEATPAEAKRLSAFSALNVAPEVLLGHESDAWAPAEADAKLLEMSRDDAPWSDLIAMDVALDLGMIDTADKIAADWKGTEDKALRAVRLSRLARYENHLDDADRYSKTALESGTVTPRVLVERAMLLVAKNRAGDVGPLLAHYPLVLGPASAWLSAYALASSGKLEEARGRTAQLDFPPALSPLPFRVMAAVSLAAMKDKKRGEPAVKGLLAAGSKDPDLLAAAVSLGIKPGQKAAPPPRRWRR